MSTTSSKGKTGHYRALSNGSLDIVGKAYTSRRPGKDKESWVVNRIYSLLGNNTDGEEIAIKIESLGINREMNP